MRTKKLTLTALGLTGLMSLGLLSSVFSAPGALGVKVRKVQGDVKQKTGKAMMTLRDGAVVRNGDSIITGKDGSVILVWETGHVLKLGPLSATMISATRETAGEKSVLKLDKGSVFARAAKLATKGSKLEIHTPTTVAGVRGTSFEVSMEGKSTTVATIRGTVNVAVGKSKEVPVPAGKQSVVDKGKPKLIPIPEKKLMLLRFADTQATTVQATSIRAANPDAGDKVESATVKAVDAQVENAILDQLESQGSGGVRFQVR